MLSANVKTFSLGSGELSASDDQQLPTIFVYSPALYKKLMLFQIKAYLKFLWNSKNEHGVHSPFVFNLVTKCFYDRTPKSVYSVLKDYRKSLLANNNYIEVTDFGAGSRVFNSNNRKISKIAKTAGITEPRAELLYRIVNYFQPENILEIGTSLGLATSALALGNPKAKITTIEGCPETMAIAKRQLHKFNFNNVDCINTEFSSYLQNSKLELQSETENCKLKSATWDLVYFDGNHSKQATLEYFELLLPTITNETVWIFDDIHWSSDMEEAWEIIKKNRKVTVTIDTFRWGLVFFRYEQQKEHFTIRV